MALSNVSWKGMKALEVMLDVLPEKLAGQKLRSAYRFALKPTLTKMREYLPPNRTGNLWFATDITIGGGKELSEMFGIVGPRRKKHVWNMQGWHSHIIESGTKPHTITAGPGKLMPVFTKSGFTGQFAKTIHHKGSRAFKPFSRAMDATWMTVGDRVADKVAGIMRHEISVIFRQFGSVTTGGKTGKLTTFDRMGGRDPSALFKVFGRVPFKG